MTCEDCLKKELGYCKFDCTEPQRCEDFKDKSEWVHLPCKEGDVLERKGERCKVDHWNVLATAFTEDYKLRLFGVEEAKKALAEMERNETH